VSKPVTNDSKIRLDDLFRWAVHLRPETAFRVIAPDLVQGVRGAVSYTRLDTQLAPLRLLPDVAYLLDGSEEPAVIVVEGQGRAPSWRRTRATTIAGTIYVSAPTGEREFELRLVELRTRERSRLANKPPPAPSGRVRFEPSNALLDLDPADFCFRDPETWPILAFSQKVSAELLDQLMANLAAIVQPDGSHNNAVTSKDVHLLGAISRVRFPEYSWSHQTQESYVNDTQTIEDSDSGHLTPEEILQLKIQAANERRRVLAEMEAAAEARGERALLLELVDTLAPQLRPALTKLESLVELKREVMALVSART
jgi:hypothetical protein